MTPPKKCNCATKDQTHTVYPYTAYPPPNQETEHNTSKTYGADKGPTLTDIGAGHIRKGRTRQKPTTISDREFSYLIEEGRERVRRQFIANNQAHTEPWNTEAEEWYPGAMRKGLLPKPTETEEWYERVGRKGKKEKEIQPPPITPEVQDFLNYMLHERKQEEKEKNKTARQR